MKYYLVGIKGSGMSALAVILHKLGNEVSGSDISKKVFTQDNLDENNIKYYDFSETNITKDIDEVIVGNVFNSDNEEVKKALDLGLKVTKYTEYLNKMTNTYDSISICGTNGKTTVTSLVDCALSNEEHITLIGDSRGIVKGNNPKYFILESCEYKSNFLNYNPDYIVLNNIEMDHPDYFTDINHVIDVFYEFCKRTKNVIVNIDDINTKSILEKLDNNIVTFGLKSGDIHFDNIIKIESGYTLDIHYKEEVYSSKNLPFYGEHMLYNALSTIALCYALGKDFNQIFNNLIKFRGAKRRFQETIISQQNKLYLIDDYAHHPTSIKLTLDAVKQKYSKQNIVAIFQAHTFSRVNEFKHEFAQSLDIADFIYVADIFGSIRETNSSVDKTVITKDINNDKLIENFEEVFSFKENTVFVLLGAGDIDVKYKNKIIESYKG